MSRSSQHPGPGHALRRGEVDVNSATVGRTYRHKDPTTAVDRQRIRDARLQAQTAIRMTRKDDAAARLEIFRQEIGTNVRSASPFLLSFAACGGISIDQLVDRIVPAPRWPRAPALGSRPATEFRRAREPYQDFLVGTASGNVKAFRMRGYGHGSIFMRSRDDWACLDVVDHSLELEARIGPVKFETLFGVLRVELDRPVPATVATACVGRSISEIVDHPALRGRPWPIVSVEEPPLLGLGQTLVVETGSVAFRMPWMR